MRVGRLSSISIAVLIILVLPLLIDNWLSRRDASFDELINSYECNRDICAADFDGDGVMGRLEKISASPTSSERWIVVTDSNRELLRLPYQSIDGTFRTHIALRSESAGARLIIFDGTAGQKNLVTAVFAWDGYKMATIPPSNLDREILRAMAARDDAGSWDEWSLYRALSIPALVAYYLFLAGIAVGFVLRHRIHFKAGWS